MASRSKLLPICTALAGLALVPATQVRLTSDPHITAASVMEAGPVWASGRTKRARASGQGTVVERSPNGMFYMEVPVNGRPMTFLIDTGASTIVLSRRDAAALGVDLTGPADGRTMRTVGGRAEVVLVRLRNIEIAGRTLNDVEAAVVVEGVGAPLLGQNVLSQLDALTIRGDRMFLQ